MVLKMYKNNLVLIQLQYVHGPLKVFHFITIKNVFQQPPQYSEESGILKFSNRKILSIHLQKNNEWEWYH